MMQPTRVSVAALCTFSMFVDGALAVPESNSRVERSESRSSLVFACTAENDLYKALVADGKSVRRFLSPGDAVQGAEDQSTVLILADGYSAKRTVVPPGVIADAKAKKLQLYIEFPEEIAGIEFGEPRGVRWERAVVASDQISLGLPALHVLSLHDCQFLPTQAPHPVLVIGRVAGFNRAVFGLPKEGFPILFRSDEGHWIATTKLSNFVTGRYAPTADWRILWQNMLTAFDPAGAPHNIVASPRVYPAYEKETPLPSDAERLALAHCAEWYIKSRLLVTESQVPELHEMLRTGQKPILPPGSEAPIGDGSHGILEGYMSSILPDGSQMQQTSLRADCQAESAAVLALHAKLTGEPRSAQVAENLMNYLYFDSELHRLERGDPKHPAFGLIAWGEIAPAWAIGNYGDDNARTLLGSIVVAACLRSDKWDEPMLRAIYANLRTTGALGFRGDRIDMPQLEQEGWKAIEQRETINLSPSFEAYSWACYLWAYARTGDRAFLDKTKIGIRKMMAAYPDGWRWGDNMDRSRMLLALAWLIRVEDTPEHRQWLKLIAHDLLQNQRPCGAIPEVLSGATTGHLLAPTSNEAYGTGETPLIQEDGDTATDQLYVTNFALLGLREAVAATGDAELKKAEDKLAQYLVRIQVRSESVPYLDGTWFRAFDFDRWDYWASSGDAGWGAWCAETGWGPAWIGASLGLRALNTSLWDLTQHSQIVKQTKKVQEQMMQNDGSPWSPRAAQR